VTATTTDKDDHDKQSNPSSSFSPPTPSSYASNKGVVYDIGATELVVGSPKVIIGNPVALPTIDGSGSERIFHVVAGE